MSIKTGMQVESSWKAHTSMFKRKQANFLLEHRKIVISTQKKTSKLLYCLIITDPILRKNRIQRVKSTIL